MQPLRILRAMPLLLICLSLGSVWAQDPPSVRARIVLHSTLASGLRHHDAKQVWEELKVGDGLQLVREPNNPYDGNAVRVVWNGRVLGYLPRTENGDIARQLDRGNALHARIASMGKYRNHRKRLGIEIYSEM